MAWRVQLQFRTWGTSRQENQLPAMQGVHSPIYGVLCGASGTVSPRVIAEDVRVDRPHESPSCLSAERLLAEAEGHTSALLDALGQRMHATSQRMPLGRLGMRLHKRMKFALPLR